MPRKMPETSNGQGRLLSGIKQGMTMEAPMEEDCLAQKGEESQLLIHQAQGPTMRHPMPTQLHTGTGTLVQKDSNQRIRETKANSGTTMERPFVESCK
jgi:hypothetical protein